MKYVSWLIVSLFAVCVFFTPAFSSDEITPDEVLRIADQEKESYFGMIAFDYIMKYGQQASPPSTKTFETSEEAIMYYGKLKDKGLKLGTPFQVYTISIDNIRDYQEGTDISDMLIQTKLWLIPLEIQGKANACMEVGFIDGKWQVVGISMGDFGEKLKEIPAEFTPGKNGNKYVKIHLAYTDFIAVENGGETKAIVPFYSEKSFEKKAKNRQGLYRASDIMPELAKKIQSAQHVQ